MRKSFEARLELVKEEAEILEKLKLFTANETRRMLAKRLKFEHTIQKPDSTAKQFLQYIDYELSLYREIGQRKIKCKVEKKKGGVELRIIKRIKILFVVGLRIFSDASLLSSFVAFYKTASNKNEPSDAIAEMLKKYPENARLWCIAANWHAHDCEDTDKALALLSEGVSKHKDNHLLYRSMIQIEFFEYSKPALPKDSSTQEIYAKKIEEIVNTTFLNVVDFDLFIDIIKFLDQYPFTQKVQESIVQHLISNFSQNEMLWHILAQRERRDVVCNIEAVKTVNAEGVTTVTIDLTDDDTDSKEKTPEEKLLACFDKYKQGLDTVPPINKPKLWIMYLDFLLALQDEPKDSSTGLKLEKLKTALKEASEVENALLEKHFVAWLKVTDHSESLSIAEKGTIAIPESVVLWKRRLCLEMIKDKPTNVNKVFKLGIKALKENALPLWLSILRYHSITSTAELMLSIYKCGIKQSAEITNGLKHRYIQWLAGAKGVDAAREAYGELAEQKPYSERLHKAMTRLEHMTMDNLENWEKAHKLACEQFGKENINVWLAYIRFFVFNNYKIPNFIERIKQIHTLAIDSLPNKLKRLFQVKFRRVRMLIVKLIKPKPKI